MIANFLIGLREGLEAALIVGILVAYLNKVQRRDLLKILWTGVAAAILTSIVTGLVFAFFVTDAPEGTQEAIAGITSLIAVAFVTWMIFWMAKQSRNLAGELRGKLEKAIEVSGFTLAGVAFFAVIREGIETSVFLWSASNATGAETNPLLGAGLGLAAATVLGILIYKGAVRLNLSAFFAYTGAFLVIVAAGIAAYGIHELQEIGWLPLLTATSYDLTSVFPDGSAQEVLLRGTIGFNANPTQLESLVWLLYAGITGYLYIKANRPKVNA